MPGWKQVAFKRSITEAGEFKVRSVVRKYDSSLDPVSIMKAILTAAYVFTCSSWITDLVLDPEQGCLSRPFQDRFNT